MIRIGFIGTGTFAVQHAEILQSLGATISACYGTNEEKTNDFAQRFHCKRYHEPLTLISKKYIDALYIVIPPFAHDGSIELQAVNEKIPFLCEKPVGLDIGICQNVATRIRENNLITSSGYQLRYESLFEQIKNIIKNESISTLRLNFYAHMPDVYWWRQSKLSGGMMVESGSHYVDLLRYICGDISHVSAISTSGIANTSIQGCDMYDSIETILRFKDGFIGSMGASHLLNKIMPRNHSLDIYGNNFWLNVDLYKLRYLNAAVASYKRANNSDWQIISKKTSKKDLLALESQAFILAVLNNQPELIKSSYIDAVDTLKVCFSINQSCSSERLVLVQ